MEHVAGLGLISHHFVWILVFFLVNENLLIGVRKPRVKPITILRRQLDIFLGNILLFIKCDYFVNQMPELLSIFWIDLFVWDTRIVNCLDVDELGGLSLGLINFLRLLMKIKISFKLNAIEVFASLLFTDFLPILRQALRFLFLGIRAYGSSLPPLLWQLAHQLLEVVSFGKLHSINKHQLSEFVSGRLLLDLALCAFVSGFGRGLFLVM